MRRRAHGRRISGEESEAWMGRGRLGRCRCALEAIGGRGCQRAGFGERWGDVRDRLRKRALISRGSEGKIGRSVLTFDDLYCTMVLGKEGGFSACVTGYS